MLPVLKLLKYHYHEFQSKQTTFLSLYLERTYCLLIRLLPGIIFADCDMPIFASLNNGSSRFLDLTLACTNLFHLPRIHDNNKCSVAILYFLNATVKLFVLQTKNRIAALACERYWLWLCTCERRIQMKTFLMCRVMELVINAGTWTVY